MKIRGGKNQQKIIINIVNRSEDNTIESKDLPVEILPWLPFLSFSHVQQGSQTPLLQKSDNSLLIIMIL